ncbi:L,D-transpeptidase catalytic domain [Loktanella atrilutea]|uniref:L,D-transpeptidase catalytic domain n=1 Tax=Loktanella atrilutea TaxID=366533 RepID=A0A1M4YJV0_LOKAT|nr:L,D-transpeptidase family protein [Loktanella atrilutea]SHF06010.1 L,D-transpeptidase catalytic domain [Loktanella atrilutea]
MLNRRFVMMGALGTLMAACAKAVPNKFKRYDGPPVTRLQVFKGKRKLQVLSGSRLLKEYDIEMGFAPEGHKQVERDGKTPEGAYLIDRRNGNSRYHLSLGISYPDSQDIARAAAMGMRPGGDIFIHGTPREYIGKTDWTWGCIAIANDEIEDLYAMVKDGTPIYIYR